MYVSVFVGAKNISLDLKIWLNIWSQDAWYTPTFSLNMTQFYIGKKIIVVTRWRISLKQISKIILSFRGLFVSVSVMDTVHSSNSYVLNIFTRIETGWKGGGLGRG